MGFYTNKIVFKKTLGKKKKSTFFNAYQIFQMEDF